jgi:hypothetical protein
MSIRRRGPSASAFGHAACSRSAVERCNDDRGFLIGIEQTATRYHWSIKDARRRVAGKMRDLPTEHKRSVWETAVGLAAWRRYLVTGRQALAVVALRRWMRDDAGPAGCV